MARDFSAGGRRRHCSTGPLESAAKGEMGASWAGTAAGPSGRELAAQEGEEEGGEKAG